METQQNHIENIDGKDWGELQVRHSGNFCTQKPWVYQLFGGINYQIEHHLFPSVCHIHFPRIKPIVKKTCKELTKITKRFSADLIISIESRGFIFAGSVAIDLLLPFILARKPGKLPNETYSKSFDLEYGSTSIEIQKNSNIKKNSQ